jgi:branched-chain amino acid transport system substrate-binding protein
VKSRSYARVGAVAVTIAIGALGLSACGSSSKATSTPATTTSAAAGGGSSSSPAGAKPTGAPIKIGTVGVYSGFSSETSLPDPQALQAWVDYTNDNGGINGHPVQLIVKDDAGVAAKSLAAVKDLIQNDHVVAIVGQNESGLEDVWAPYAASQKVPVIGGAANGGSWLTNPNMFPASGTTINTQTTTANAALIAGKKNYSVIYCAEVPACSEVGVFGKMVAAKLGLNYAGAQSVAASATTYTSQCLSLKGKGADSVFLASSIDVATRFLANCTSQGFTPTPIDDVRNWSAPQLKNKVWEGAILASEGPLWFGNDPATQTFQAAMKKYAPNTIGNSNGPLGWVAGVVFGDAAKAGIAAGATPTSADVLTGLYSFGPNFTAGNLMPPVTYAAGKPASQPKACGWYAKVVNGAYTTPKGASMVCVGS